MGRAPALWHPLSEAVGRPRSYGHKATRLAELRAVGVPVLDGCVLAVDDAASVDSDRALAFARALVDLHPDVHRWLLRSSSPLEDTEDGTAAGVFESLACDAVVEEIARAVLTVIASASRASTLRALGRTEPAPVAVLAQPHLTLARWCTIEVRGERALVEGWSLDADGTPRATCHRAGEGDSSWRPLERLALAAHAHGREAASLLELAEDASGDDWLLQLRRAPRADPPWSTGSTELPATTPPAIAGLGLHVHRDDERHAWSWDREHSPTPLCPLLAGLFGRWILEHPTYGSRIAHGRWHDRATPAPSTAGLDAATLDATLDRWREHERSVLRPALDGLRGLVAAPWPRVQARERWSAFVDAWMKWQGDYFASPSGALRTWARRRVDALAAGGTRIPRLGTRTVAAQRDSRWHALAARLHAHPAPPMPTAQALSQWIQMHHDDPLARDLLDELENCGHLCAWAFDGRAVPWEFEPTPLWRAIARRMTFSPSPVPIEAEGHDDDRARIVAILARAEDDDDLLLMAYQQWHRAIRRVHAALDDDRVARPTDLLDLDPAELEAALAPQAAPIPPEAFARGRALAQAWRAWPSDAGPAALALRGVGAAGGRAEGPVVRALHLADVLPTDEAMIAVVSTVGPADAVDVPGLLALVCEGGDVLGHASVLAREHGIPCVVGVADARRRLARANRVLVDGDRGEITVLDANA